MPEDKVMLRLSRDEALVLYDWLCARDRTENPEVTAEVQVLWVLEGQLEKTLVEPLAPNYRELVEKARQRIHGGTSGGD